MSMILNIILGILKLIKMDNKIKWVSQEQKLQFSEFTQD